MSNRACSLRPCLLLPLALWSLLSGQAARAADAPNVAKAATEAVDQRLAGKSPSPFTLNLLGLGDFSKGLIAWNATLWCADWNPYFTCFSLQNSREVQYQGGTLITSKHLLFAEHFSGASGSNTLQGGDTFKFVGKFNAPYTRKLLATPVRVGSSDLCLGTLDRDLPPDILPAQVLPPGLPPDFLPPGTPVLFTNKNKELRPAEVASFGGQSIMPARSPLRAPWTLPGPAAVGDSGCPVFVILNGRPVLWWLFHVANGGDNLSVNISTINKMLGKGYQLNVAKVEGD